MVYQEPKSKKKLLIKKIQVGFVLQNDLSFPIVLLKNLTVAVKF